MTQNEERREMNIKLYEVLGTLSANVHNLTSKFEEMVTTQKDMGKAIQAFQDINIRVRGLENEVKEIKETIKEKQGVCFIEHKNYIEKFDLVYEDRKEIKKDFSFLRKIREDSEFSKKRILGVVVTKIAEFTFLLIALGVATKIGLF